MGGPRGDGRRDLLADALVKLLPFGKEYPEQIPATILGVPEIAFALPKSKPVLTVSDYTSDDDILCDAAPIGAVTAGQASGLVR
jgi:hypothetical protein